MNPALPAALACAVLATPGDDWAPSWEHWRDYLRPAPAEEAWLAVDWRPVFWDAVLEAHESEKPILLWAMNGHPLGCT